MKDVWILQAQFMWSFIQLDCKDEYSADQLAVLNMKQHYHYPHQESVRALLQPPSTGKNL
jgi:hypothetical protein